MANIPQKPVIENQIWINGQTKLNQTNLTNGVNQNITNLKTAVDGIIDALGGPGGESASDKTLDQTSISDYNPATTYTQGQVVIHDGKYYRAKENGVTGTWDVTKWSQIALSTPVDSALDEDSTNPVQNAAVTAKVNEVEGRLDTAESNVGKIFDDLAPAYSASSAYEVGDYCIHEGSFYKCAVKIASDEAWNAAHWEVANVGDDLKGKITFGSSWFDGTGGVGYADNADQLNSTIYVTDQTPYLYRTSGGDADIGNREKDTIVGGSLGWNQLINNTNIAVSNISLPEGSSYKTIASAGDLVLNHKHLVTIKMDYSNAPSANTDRIHINVSKVGVGNYINRDYLLDSNKTASTVINSSYDGSSLGVFVNSTSFGTGETVSYSNYNIHDLTAIFGATIADYIYSLEQATLGAGVAWFRKLFPKPYYPYKAIGGFLHVKLISHDMVHFNQWDEEWDNGSFDNQGQETTSGAYIRSKNFIRVLPNTQYYFEVQNKTCWLYFYDENKNFIPLDVGENHLVYKPLYAGSSHVFDIPAGARYMKFLIDTTYGTTYNHDICINLSWSGWRNGQYETYKKSPYPLDTSVILRGIPKLDADNNLYYDGDKYHADGTVDEECEEYTFTENETIIGFGTLDGNCRFQLYLDSVANTGSSDLPTNISSPNADIISPETWYARTKSGFTIGVSGYGTAGRVECAIVGVSTQEDAKAWLKGKTIVFKKATPTTSSADPFQETQEVDDFGTEEYVVPEQDGVAVPVGHYTEYPANLRDKLQRLPDMPPVSQNVTETFVVNYNGTSKKCSFMAIEDWLGDNGYNKMQVLSDQITDVREGLTILQKKLYVIGNVATLTIRLQNTSGSTITGGNLFRLPSYGPLCDTAWMGYDNASGGKNILYSVDTKNVSVGSTTTIGAGSYLYMTVSYAVA